MRPYHRPPINHSPPGAPPYELPPVQSITSPSGHFPPVSALPSRPDSDLKMTHLLQPLTQPLPPTLPAPTPSYSRSYDSASGSPAERPALLSDASRPNGGGGGMMGPAGLALPAAVGPGQPQTQQKRAYRQRRKDPSCDACRERKVKCDASESASCTECTNRKVRCQFTKETNRRMSSIKQVQDLEKQLLSTKQQLEQLRSGALRGDQIMDIETDQTGGQTSVKLPDIGHIRPPRRTRAPIAEDLSNVRSNLRNYGRAILKVPTPYRQRSPGPALNGETPQLPPKSFADRLLAQYFSCIHAVLPVIHWPSFTAEYEKVYSAGSLAGVRREWAAVLFGIFACGCLHTLERNKIQEGKRFISVASSIIDVWQDDFSIDQARCALLVSIFLYEVNSKSASWIWIGSGVRIAQELGLHIDSGPWSTVEGEMRKRVWWGMYAWDRLLALEMGKPILINDEDCDADLPCPVDDQYISDGGRAVDAQAQRMTPLLATIHVVRSLGQLTKTFRSRVVSPATLETFDRHFSACSSAFPAEYHLSSSDQYLDPRSLAPIIYLQNARLFLHRHNLSPFCAHDVRSAAISNCVSISLDTSRLLSRCMLSPSSAGAGAEAGFASPSDGDHHHHPQTQWRTILASAATTMLCTHIWRCTLLLLFRQEYAAALTCIQAGAAIGDSRSVNAACGRYVAFFLRCILDRLSHRNNEHVVVIGGGGGADLFDHDEELMAYASGDLQGTMDGSWIWQGSETGSELDTLSPTSASDATSASVSASASAHGTSSHPGIRGEWISSPEGGGAAEPEWEGWEWLEGTVQYLLNEKQQQQQQQPYHHQQVHHPASVYDRMDVEQSPSRPHPHSQPHAHSKPIGTRFESSALLSPESAASVSASATTSASASASAGSEPAAPRRSSSTHSRMTIASII